MNRMKTVIKLTFAHVEGIFKFMAKLILILCTFGQACPVSTYMAESEKAKKNIIKRTKQTGMCTKHSERKCTTAG